MRLYGRIFVGIGIVLLIAVFGYDIWIRSDAGIRYQMRLRLTAILTYHGKIVVWTNKPNEKLVNELQPIKERIHEVQSKGTSLAAPIIADELRSAKLVHIIDMGDFHMFLFEELRNPTTIHASTADITKQLQVGPIHFHNATLYTVRTFGAVNLMNEEVLQNAIYYDEVKSIQEWIFDNHSRRLFWMFGTCALFLFIGSGGVLIPLFCALRARWGKKDTEPLYILPARADEQEPEQHEVPVEIVPRQDPEEIRLTLLRELTELTAQHIGDQRDILLTFLDKARGERRVSKVRYLLDEARAIVGDTLEKTGAKQNNRHYTQEPNFPESYAQDLSPADPLPIEDLLPIGMQPHAECIRTILLVLLRYGGQSPYFADNTRYPTQVRKSVIGKGYRDTEFDTCFSWLVKKRVINLFNKHRSKGFMCSLQQSPEQVEEDAREITYCVLRAALYALRS